MNKIYTNICEIKNKILEDYYNEAVELNALFFDFNVRIPEKDLLELYASIQSIINGDIVMRLENIQIEETGEANDKIWGIKTESIIPKDMYENVYEGNYKEFLESFNGREEETGLCRVMDIEEKDNFIGGSKLDFIL